MSDHFMELQMSDGAIAWVRAELRNVCETVILPLDEVTTVSQPDAEQDIDALRSALASAIGSEADDIDPESIEVFTGYGARLSAPGYMDQTDWIVCDDMDELADEVDRMFDRCIDCDRDTSEPMPVEVSPTDDAYDQHGNLVAPETPESEQVFCVYAMCNRCAQRDQTILGSRWEIADDVSQAYTSLNAQDIDELMDRLAEEDYAPEEI